MPGEAKRIGAHAKDGEHFLISDNLTFNVRELFGVGKILSLV